MEIVIEPHTLARAAERGASLDEIEQVLYSGVVEPARGGRLAMSRVFAFEAVRNGRYYAQKQVRVVYVVEGERIVTVTVFVYYGTWTHEIRRGASDAD